MYLSLAFLALVLCSSMTVYGHSKNKRIIKQLLDDVDELQSDGEDLILSIDALEQGLNEKLTAYMEGDEFDTNSTEPDVTEEEEHENDPDAERKRKLIRRLKKVEEKIKEINYFVYQEALVDEALKKLPTEVMEHFRQVIVQAESDAEAMNNEVQSALDDVEPILESVDASARARNVVVAGALYHGGIGSGCLAENTDCSLENSTCQQGTCQCNPGLSYNALLRKCVQSCRYYGDTFQTIPNHIIREYNKMVINETSIDNCKKTCRETEEFSCRSIDFFPRWHTCYLSEFVKSEVPEEKWEINFAGIHFQRDCAYY